MVIVSPLNGVILTTYKSWDDPPSRGHVDLPEGVPGLVEGMLLSSIDMKSSKYLVYLRKVFGGSGMKDYTLENLHGTQCHRGLEHDFSFPKWVIFLRFHPLIFRGTPRKLTWKPENLPFWERRNPSSKRILHSLKLTFSPLKIGHPKRKLVFQPSIFRCELLVSGSVLGFMLVFGGV